MACTQSNSVGIGAIQVAAEVAMTAVAVIGSIYYYKQVKKDIDSLKDLSEKFVSMGEEYCAAQRELETYGKQAFEYAQTIPTYKPSNTYAYTGMSLALAGGNEQLLKVGRAYAAYDVSSRCQARTDFMRNVISIGSNAATKGMILDKTLQEDNLSRRVKARIAMVSDTPPNIESTMSVISKVMTDKLSDDATTFNSFFTGVGRGVTSLINRFSGAYNEPTGGFF